jgi:hypothetical protein
MTDEESDVIFREVQRFSLWLRTVFALSMAAAVVIDGIALNSMLAERYPPSRVSTASLVIFGIVLPIALAVLLWAAKLETEVRSEALYVHLFPFHIRYRKITPGDLNECYARTYRPLIEYGGWGIRCGFGGRGRAYNMSGNQGVQLIMNDGRKLLIGTQRPDELAGAIGSMTQGS